MVKTLKFRLIFHLNILVFQANGKQPYSFPVLSRFCNGLWHSFMFHVLPFWLDWSYNLGQNKWSMQTIPPPFLMLPKWPVFAPSRLHRCFCGGGGGGGWGDGWAIEWICILFYLSITCFSCNVTPKLFSCLFRLLQRTINTTSKMMDKAPNSPVKIARIILISSGKKNIYINFKFNLSEISRKFFGLASLILWALYDSISQTSENIVNWGKWLGNLAKFVFFVCYF